MFFFNQQSASGFNDVGERISETYQGGENTIKSFYKGQL